MQSRLRDISKGGFQIVPAIVSSRELSQITAAIKRYIKRHHPSVADETIRSVQSAYSHNATEALLERLIPAVTERVRRPVLPTFSYWRVYGRRHSLPIHVDRPECEVTLTITISRDSDARWPLFIITGGAIHAITLEPGDGLLFNGTKVPHWRRPLNGRRWVQATLHYVYANGPNAAAAHDRRSRLNLR